MTRLFGYLLGTLSGLAFVGSTLALLYQTLIVTDDEKDNGYGQFLTITMLILTVSFVAFYYVYQTGFGHSKLQRAQEELEILKINQEITKIKSTY